MRIVDKINELSLFGFVLCIFEKIKFKVIGLFYNVEKWHLNTPFNCRRYKKTVVNVVNNLNPLTVVEVGCGSGDIISRISAKSKIAFDIDDNIISFAENYYKNKNVCFNVGSFETVLQYEDKLNQKIDCLVLVNWVHLLSCTEIKEKLDKYIFENFKVKYIIFDKYISKYHVHDFRCIDNIELIDEIKTDAQRSILVFEVKK